jgi:hypothetical protein
VTARTGIDTATEAVRGSRRAGTLGRARGSERAAGKAFEYLLLACLGFGVLVLAVLLYDVATTGAPRFNLDLIRNMPSGRAV